MFRHTALRWALLGLLVAGALARAFTAEFFGLEILIEILILAMLVIALDLVAGFGGMVSLCHGALMGAGAYAYAMLTVRAGVDPALAMLGAMAVAGAGGWAV
ncbi:MAG: branched-chain amino acid ABC transporter permease, partial [Pseudomonadota bacterium]